METMQMIIQTIMDFVLGLTEIEVPIIGITFFQLYAGIFVVGLSLKILNILFEGALGSGDDDEGGNNKNIRVSKTREGDER